MKNIKYLFVLIVVVATGFFISKNFEFGKKTAIEEQFAADLEIINDEQANPDQFIRSMIRLGKAKNQTAFEVAQKRYQDTNQLVRAACFETIGFYDKPEAIQVLSAGLADAEKVVRLAAARGVARVATPERIEMILSKIKDDANSGGKDSAKSDGKDAAQSGAKDATMTTQEKIELLAALSRIGGEKEIQMALDWLLQFAKSGDKLDHADATFRAAAIAPSDARVLALLKSKLQGSKDARVVGFALRHLASLRDAAVMSDLKKYLDDMNPDIRISAIQSTALSCAPNRWKLLEDKAKNESDPRVLKALIDAPKIILGVEATNFLAQIAGQSQLPADLIELAKKNAEEVKRNEKNSPCANR